MLRATKQVKRSWADEEDTASSPSGSGTCPSGPGPSGESQTSETLNHSTGTCQPCVFHSSLLGCRQASDCSYCHLYHPDPKRRPGLRKDRRERIQERIRGHFDSYLGLH